MKAVNVLRDHGANFQLKNSLGYTAVDVAEMLGNTRCHGIASEPPPRQVLQHSQHHQLPKEGLSLHIPPVLRTLIYFMKILA